MTTFLIVAGLILLIVVIIATAKHQGDRILDELLATEEREIERCRQRGIQSGFTAGWHGGSGRS